MLNKETLSKVLRQLANDKQVSYMCLDYNLGWIPLGHRIDDMKRTVMHKEPEFKNV